MESSSGYDELINALIDPSFIDSINLGLVLQDVDGHIVECNAAATEILGLSYDEILGRTSRDIDWGAVREDGTDFPGAEHPAMLALDTGEPVRNVVMGVDAPRALRRWIVIDAFPVRRAGEIIGVMTSFNDQTAQITSERLLRLLAGVNQLVIDASSEEQFYADLVPLLARGHDAVGISLVLEDGRVFVAGRELPDAVLCAGALDGVLGPAATALQRREALVDNDLGGAEPVRWRRDLLDIGAGAIMTLPVNLGGVRGALCAVSERARVFTDATVNGFDAVMREIEFGVEHVRSLHRLQSALHGTLDALSGMTESRDPYTVGHQSRVGALSERIARRLGLGEELVHLIGLAAEVHDVGKIGVPVEILTRPGRLAPVEMDIVREHVRIGHQILRRAQLPWPIAEVALQHHERLDGSGYPEHLVGELIILPARIVAVADVVEAVTQSRPYRPGLGVERALQIVEQGAGLLFDPHVVAACRDEFAAGFGFE